MKSISVSAAAAALVALSAPNAHASCSQGAEIVLESSTASAGADRFPGDALSASLTLTDLLVCCGDELDWLSAEKVVEPMGGELDHDMLDIAALDLDPTQEDRVFLTDLEGLGNIEFRDPSSQERRDSANPWADLETEIEFAEVDVLVALIRHPILEPTTTSPRLWSRPTTS